MADSQNKGSNKGTFNRAPLMLVLILLLLVYIGIQITEGLGWLTVEEWMADIGGMIMTFFAVIIAAIIFSFVWIKFLAMRRKKGRRDMDFYLSTAESTSNNDANDGVTDSNKGEG